MNLLQSDVNSACQALAPWGIPSNKITCGWYAGHISIIIECELNIVAQKMLRSLLESKTSINIPIIFKQPATGVLERPVIKDFKFNFDTVP